MPTGEHARYWRPSCGGNSAGDVLRASRGTLPGVGRAGPVLQSRSYRRRRCTSRHPSQPPGTAGLATTNTPVVDLDARARRLEVAVPKVGALAAGLRVGLICSVKFGPLLSLGRAGLAAGGGQEARRASDSSHGVTTLGEGRMGRDASLGIDPSTYQGAVLPRREHPPPGAFLGWIMLWWVVSDRQRKAAECFPAVLLAACPSALAAGADVQAVSIQSATSRMRFSRRTISPMSSSARGRGVRRGGGVVCHAGPRGALSTFMPLGAGRAVQDTETVDRVRVRTSLSRCPSGREGPKRPRRCRRCSGRAAMPT